MKLTQNIHKSFFLLIGLFTWLSSSTRVPEFQPYLHKKDNLIYPVEAINEAEPQLIHYKLKVRGVKLKTIKNESRMYRPISTLVWSGLKPIHSTGIVSPNTIGILAENAALYLLNFNPFNNIQIKQSYHLLGDPISFENGRTYCLNILHQTIFDKIYVVCVKLPFQKFKNIYDLQKCPKKPFKPYDLKYNQILLYAVDEKTKDAIEIKLSNPENEFFDSGKLDILMMKFGVLRTPMAIIYDSKPKSNTKMFKLRYMLFSKNGNISYVSTPLTLNLNFYKVVKYYGLTILNNRSFISILVQTQKPQKKTKKWEILQVEINIKYEKIVVMNRIHIKNIKKMKEFIMLKDSSMLLMNKNTSTIRICSIIKMKRMDPCINFSHIIVAKSEKIINYQLINMNAVFTVQNKYSLKTRIVVAFGYRGIHFINKYPPVFFPNSSGFLYQNQIIIQKTRNFSVYPFIEPQIGIRRKRNKVQKGSVILDYQAQNSKAISSNFKSIFLRNPLNSSTQISSIPSLEVYGKKVFRLYIGDYITSGNIVDYKLKLSDSSQGKSCQINYELKTSEEYYIAINEIEDNRMEFGQNLSVLSKNNSSSRVMFDCRFQDMKYYCTKELEISEKKSLIFQEMQVTDYYSILLFFDKKGDKKHHKDQKQNYRQDEEILKVKRQVMILLLPESDNMEIPASPKTEHKINFRVDDFDRSFLIKITQKNTILVTCTKNTCAIYRIEYTKETSQLYKIGIIDNLFLKMGNFCPKKVYSNEMNDKSFFIKSECPESPQLKYSSISKIQILGNSLYYQMTKIIPSQHEVSICGRDTLLLLDHENMVLGYKYFLGDLKAQRNKVRLRNLGLSSISHIKCFKNEILIIGPKIGHRVKSLVIVLKKTRYESGHTFLDNKGSMIRGKIEIETSSQILNSYNYLDPVNNKEYIYLLLQLQNKVKIIKKLYLGYGPEIKIWLKEGIKQSFKSSLVLIFKDFYGDSFSRSVNIFYDHLHLEYQATPKPFISLPVLRKGVFPMDQLLHVQGFIEEYGQPDGVEDTGFDINDRVEGYEIEVAKNFTNNKESNKLLYFQKFEKFEDLRVGYLDQYNRKNRMSFRFWIENDKHLTDFTDTSLFLGTQVELTLFRSKTSKEIFFMYSSTEYQNQIYLRVLSPSGKVIQRMEDKTDFSIINTQLHIIQEKNRHYLYYAGINLDSGDFEIYRSSLQRKKLDFRLLILRQINTTIFSYIREDDMMHIVYVSQRGYLIMMTFDFLTEKYLKEKRPLKLETQVLVKQVKCQAYTRNSTYVDLIGHCVVHTEGRRSFHLQIPRIVKQALISKPMYFPDYYQKSQLKIPLWDISDNFAVHFCSQIVSVKADEIDPLTFTEYGQDKTILLDGLMFWKFADREGMPFRFFLYSGDEHPFLIGTSLENDEELLIVDKSDYNDFNHYRIQENREAEIVILNPETIKKKKPILRIFGVSGHKDIVLTDLFKEAPIKKERSKNDRYRYGQRELVDSGYKRDEGEGERVIDHRNFERNRIFNHDQEQPTILELLYQILRKSEVIAFLLGVLSTCLIFVIFMTFGSPKTRVIYLQNGADRFVGSSLTIKRLGKHKNE